MTTQSHESYDLTRDRTHFLPGASVRRIPNEDLSTREVRDLALDELCKAVDLVWSARIRLGALVDRGERVKGLYEAAVKASVACDRALARASKVKPR